MRRSATSAIAETAATNGIVGGVGVVTGIIAARWLGPQGRGELAAIQMWPSVLASLGMIGMAEALVYFAAKRPRESRRYLSTACLLALIAMPLFAGVGYVLMPRLLTQQSPQIVQAARRYLFLLPIYAFIGLPYQVLRGVRRYRLWNAMRIVPSVLWLALLVVAMLIHVAEPARLTTAYLFALAIVGPLLVALVWRSVGGAARPNLRAARDLIGFGLPSAMGSLPQFFNLKLDQILVTGMVAPTQLGIYMAAVAWGSSIPMLSNAVGLVFSPRIAGGGSDAERQRHFSHGIRGAAWLTAGAVVCLAAATPIGITIAFGRAFQAAVIPAAILAVASGVNALNGVFEELLRGYGRPAATFRAESAAALVGLPTLLVLVPRLGLVGAAVGSLVGYLAATSALLVESRRVADLQLRDVLDLKGLISSMEPVAASVLAVLRPSNTAPRDVSTIVSK
ncbi:MAG TPA: polysaccharide biosynthesis C-terminal domain-containing protein [Vicinamibacterales bacterium]|nr:polysaccharide biosynthesis C-terminal domain-containing protein [Vicinamibacterales bacterium]